MPTRLLDRCRTESIGEWRTAARERFDDGLMLSVASRRTGAIYLWGYTAEMILKAAYLHEMKQARQAAEWFLVHADSL